MLTGIYSRHFSLSHGLSSACNWVCCAPRAGNTGRFGHRPSARRSGIKNWKGRSFVSFVKKGWDLGEHVQPESLDDLRLKKQTNLGQSLKEQGTYRDLPAECNSAPVDPQIGSGPKLLSKEVLLRSPIPGSRMNPRKAVFTVETNRPIAGSLVTGTENEVEANISLGPSLPDNHTKHAHDKVKLRAASHKDRTGASLHRSKNNSAQQPDNDACNVISTLRSRGDSTGAPSIVPGAVQARPFNLAQPYLETQISLRKDGNDSDSMQLLRVTSFIEALDLLRSGNAYTLDPTSLLAGWFHHNEHRLNVLKQKPKTFARFDYFDILLLYNSLGFSINSLKKSRHSDKAIIRVLLNYHAVGMAMTALSETRARTTSQTSVTRFRTNLYDLLGINDQHAAAGKILWMYSQSMGHPDRDTTVPSQSLIKSGNIPVSENKPAQNSKEDQLTANHRAGEGKVTRSVGTTIHSVLSEVQKDLSARKSNNDPLIQRLSGLPESLLKALCNTRLDVVDLKTSLAKCAVPEAVYELISIVHTHLESYLRRIRQKTHKSGQSTRRLGLHIRRTGLVLHDLVLIKKELGWNNQSPQTSRTEPQLYLPASCDKVKLPPERSQNDTSSPESGMIIDCDTPLGPAEEFPKISKSVLQGAMFEKFSVLRALFNRMRSKKAKLLALECSIPFMESTIDKLEKRLAKHASRGFLNPSRKLKTKLSLLKANYALMQEWSVALKVQLEKVPEIHKIQPDEKETLVSQAARSLLPPEVERRLKSGFLFSIYSLDWCLATLSLSQQASLLTRLISELKTKIKFRRRRGNLSRLDKCQQQLMLIEDRYKSLQKLCDVPEKMAVFHRPRNRFTGIFYATLDQEIKGMTKWKAAEEKIGERLYAQDRSAFLQKNRNKMSEPQRILKRQYETSTLKLETGTAYLKKLITERTENPVPTHPEGTSSMEKNGYNTEKSSDNEPQLLTIQPLRAPYDIHHYVLGNILHHIKVAMYTFGQREFPFILELRNWSRPESVPISEFMAVMERHPVISDLYKFFAYEFQSLRLLRNSYAHSSTDITLEETCTLLRDMQIIARVLSFPKKVPRIKPYEDLLVSFKHKYQDANSEWRKSGLATLRKRELKHRTACKNIDIKIADMRKRIQKYESQKSAAESAHGLAVSAFLKQWKIQDSANASRLAKDLATYALEERVRRSLRAMSSHLAASLVQRLSNEYALSASARSDEVDTNVRQASETNPITSHARPSSKTMPSDIDNNNNVLAVSSSTATGKAKQFEDTKPSFKLKPHDLTSRKMTNAENDPSFSFLEDEKTQTDRSHLISFVSSRR